MPTARHHRRRNAFLLAAVIATALVPRASAGQADTYSDIVSRYIDDADGAMNALNRWTQPATRKAVTEFEARVPHPPPARAEAAVMLHTDLALALLPDQAALADFHLHLARGLVERRAIGEPLEFRSRWFSVLVTLQWTRGRIKEADQAAQDAAAAMPTVSHFHVLLGELAEARAAILNPNLRGADPASTARSQKYVEGELRTAVYEYLDALKIDPHDVDAHLRLGWVYYLQHRDMEARREIDAVQHGDHTSSAQQYLARLFRGALDERAGDLHDAASDYDDAIAACVSCQSAYAGRIRVATDAGDAATARQRTAVYASVPKPTAGDPWWDAHIGGADNDSLAWLHQEVHK